MVSRMCLAPTEGFAFVRWKRRQPLSTRTTLRHTNARTRKHITGEDMATVSSTCAFTPTSSLSSQNVTHHIRSSHIHETDQKWASAETAQIGILYVFRQHQLLYGITRNRHDGKCIVPVRYSWLRSWTAPAL